MKMTTSFFIFLVCVFAVYGLPDGATQTDIGSAKINDIRATLSIENRALEFKDTSKCMEKMLCVLAARQGSESCQHIKSPLDFYVKIATCPEQETDRSISYRKVKTLLSGYSKFKALLLSSSIGESTKDESVCSTIYPECSLNPVELTAMTTDFGKITNLTAENPLKKVLDHLITADGSLAVISSAGRGVRSKRSCDDDADKKVCNSAWASCGVAGTACVVCSIFSFGFCAPGCAAGTAGICSAIGNACEIARNDC